MRSPPQLLLLPQVPPQLLGDPDELGEDVDVAVAVLVAVAVDVAVEVAVAVAVDVAVAVPPIVKDNLQASLAAFGWLVGAVGATGTCLS